MNDILAPLLDYNFMQQAMLAGIIMALGAAPIGVLLLYRRMSLMGEALSHAILPGAALAYFLAGMSLSIMSLGGLLAGLLVAFCSSLAVRLTSLKDDASFTVFYLLALALGVVLVSAKGTAVDIVHILFGNLLAVQWDAIEQMAAVAAITLGTLFLFRRPIILESFDRTFMQGMGSSTFFYHFLFLALVVLNLVSGFQSLGTLMSIGLMMLPAIAASFCATRLWPLMGVALFVALSSVFFGLIMSYHVDIPSGPAVVLVAGVFAILAMLLGPHQSLCARYLVRAHYKT
jgi:zinc/manganese transport system permease protein